MGAGCKPRARVRDSVSGVLCGSNRALRGVEGACKPIRTCAISGLLMHAIALQFAVEGGGDRRHFAAGGLAGHPGLEQHFGGQLFERGGAGLRHGSRQDRSARADRVVQLLQDGGRKPRRHAPQETAAPAPDHFSNPRHHRPSARPVGLRPHRQLFAAAARQLDQAEPSVQRAAREMERIAGVASSKGAATVRLTPSGKALPARPASRCKELESAVRKSPNSTAGSTARSPSAPAAGAQPDHSKGLASWCERRPAASIEMIDGPYDLLIHSLAMGEIDMLVGALRESPAPRGLRAGNAVRRRAWRSSARVRPSAHGSTSPAPADLASYPWILPRKGTPTRAIFDALRGRHGIETQGFGLIETGSLVAIRGITDGDRPADGALARRQIAMSAAPAILPSCCRWSCRAPNGPSV
jgi:LysR family transcriptional regulator, regulator for genes of the gallate degradation pathway